MTAKEAKTISNQHNVGGSAWEETTRKQRTCVNGHVHGAALWGEYHARIYLPTLTGASGPLLNELVRGLEYDGFAVVVTDDYLYVSW